MDLTHGGWPRRLVWAGAVAGAAATLCVVTLTGHGHRSTRRPSIAAAPVGQAAQLATGPAAAAAQLAGHAAPATRPARPNPWLINPDAPLPRPSPWRPVLAVAGRFSAAYLSYEVDAMKPAVRRGITGTCTTPFAAQLLSHRPTLPPGVRPDQVRQRLIGVAPLERVLGAAVTLVTVRSSDSDRTPSAFELRLVRGPTRPPGWRVAAITVL
jgi:hypothetical protein